MHPIPLSFQHGERHCMPSSSTSSLVSSPFRTFPERCLLSSTFGQFASNRHPLASKKRQKPQSQ